MFRCEHERTVVGDAGLEGGKLADSTCSEPNTQGNWCETTDDSSPLDTERPKSRESVRAEKFVRQGLIQLSPHADC